MTATKHPSAENAEKVKESGILKRSFAILGPGLIARAADDDPSGISTYSVAGAVYGYATLWIALLTFPLTVRQINDLQAESKPGIWAIGLADGVR